MTRVWLLLALLGSAILFAFPNQQAAAADVSVTIQGFKFEPETITVPAGTTVTWTNKDSSRHTATSDTRVFSSPLLDRDQSFSFTFTQPGEYGYFCDPHPFMRGKVIVQASSAAPTLQGPPEGARLTAFGASLSWTNPVDARQVHLQVVPHNNDGPGVNLVLGSAATSFAIPPPPQWYGLLPDMTYTWRVRTSGSTAAADPGQDSSWTPWAERRFRTPTATGQVLPASPRAGESVASRTPTLQWSVPTPELFYFEVQVSRDPAFGPSSFLYRELRHGGVTTPPNSYNIPAAFPLQPHTVYHWRVRPRVQGDGAPVAWAGPWTFTVHPPG